MKKVLFFTMALLVTCIVVNAQDTLGYKYQPPKTPDTHHKTRINVYGSYVFDDGIQNDYDSYNYFDGTIKGGLQYGAGIEFMPHPGYGVEVLWIHQTTTVPMTYVANSYFGNNNLRSTTFDLNLNYAMLALGKKMRKPGSPMEGYGGLMLGAAFFDVENPETGNTGSETKFAWGLRLGGNIWTASEKVAIKIEARLLSAVQGASGGFYIGTGGTGAGVSMYSSMYQFSVGAGLALAIGE